MFERRIAMAWTWAALGVLCCVPQAARSADAAQQPEGLEAAATQKVYGDILVNDPASGTIVGVKTDHGRVVEVQIDSYKSGVNLRLDYREAGKPPLVTYRVGSLHPVPHLLSWIDLNGDGIFDTRIAIGNWPALNGETGARAYVGGKWLPFVKEAKPDNDGYERAIINIEGKAYHFDFAAGKWVAGAK